MGMTMTQKILAAHAHLDSVEAGQLIEADLDLVLGNDITTPVAINEIKKMKTEGVFDRDKIALVMDHFIPNKDIKSAEHCKCVREFALKHDITNYFDVGQMGIEHALLPEQGLTVAGDAIIGADSHTCTYGALYRSLEFTGEGVKNLSMDDRLCICNMAIEAGAKNGIFPVDDIARAYLDEHSDREYKVYSADEDAVYDETITIDLSKLKSTVAYPHLPENTRTIDEVEDIKIDQVVIGSCTNGRFEDLAMADRIIKGNKIAEGVRCIIIPGTQNIYLKALEAGFIKDFIEAGAVVSTPTCGPCLGGYMGILASGEKCVSTTNRNFIGRMGAIDSEIYLASPAVAAASALTGKISGPK